MPKKSVDALEVELAESLHLKEREALITECENQCKTIMKIVTSDILSQGRPCPLAPSEPVCLVGSILLGARQCPSHPSPSGHDLETPTVYRDTDV